MDASESDNARNKAHVACRWGYSSAVRRALPGCGNEIIYLIRYSSLAYIVTCIEPTGEARVLASRTFRPVEVYLLAVCYHLAPVTAAAWLLAARERSSPLRKGGTCRIFSQNRHWLRCKKKAENPRMRKSRPFFRI